MITCRVKGCASIVRVHLDLGEVAGEHPVFLVSLVAEFQTPAPFRDDLGFVMYTQTTMTGYSEN